MYSKLLYKHEAEYIFRIYKDNSVPKYICADGPMVGEKNPTVGVDRNRDISVMVDMEAKPTLIDPDQELEQFIVFTHEISDEASL